jgi:uncharacterized phage-associated protein
VYPSNERLDREKFTSAVLYLLAGCRDRSAGLTKLVKLLYYADFTHYRQHLRPITGVDYAALPNGPVPHDYEALLGDLKKAGALDEKEVPIRRQTPMKPMRQYVARQEADIDVFDEAEIETLDLVLERHGHKTGKQLITESHAEGPWRSSWDPDQQGRAIPYATARWAENLPDDADQDRAKDALRRPHTAAALAHLRTK